MVVEDTTRWVLGDFEARARRRVLQAHLDYAFAEGLVNTVQVPPEGAWILAGPATDVESQKLRHSAASFRRMLDGLLGQHQGVQYTLNSGQDLRVTATGPPDVNVNVAAGACYVRGTQAPTQGMYHLYNDASLAINVLGPNPAHATLDRIDLVVARIQDQAYSGAVDLPTIEMVTGTPSGSPVVPTAPANTLILAQLSIVHATATIPQSAITDKRTPCGVQPVLLFSGDTTGAAVASVSLPGTPATQVFPPGFRKIETDYRVRDTGASTNFDGLNIQLNADVAGNYDGFQFAIADNTAAFPAPTATPGFAGTSARVGVTAQGGLGNANLYDQGKFTIEDPFGAAEKEIFWEGIVKTGVAAGNTSRVWGSSYWRSAAALLSMKLFCNTTANNIKIVYAVYGYPWV